MLQSLINIGLEFKRKNNIRNLVIFFLFLTSVLFTQLFPHYLIMVIILTALFLVSLIFSSFRIVALTSSAFVCGFSIFHVLEDPLVNWLLQSGISPELGVILSRFLLVFYIVFLLLVSVIIRSKPIYYWKVGDFKQRLSFPWIWKGFDHPPIWLFLIIFSIVTCGIFLVNISLNPNFEISTVLLIYSFLFAIINAPLEEFIWRGIILSRLSESTDIVSALLITSFGFGFYHYSLGIPLAICLAFGVGSIYMAGLTVKSGGLLPVVIFHFVLNFWMFFSGAITVHI
ncbi:type II CAAX endopeptidase family protein [Halobacillus sp. HZG1]|nr:type II CAAX endopeptidase family protein [Halobacillus sp. HZG1]